MNFFAFAMARSGHHAILNWIANQVPGGLRLVQTNIHGELEERVGTQGLRGNATGGVVYTAQNGNPYDRNMWGRNLPHTRTELLIVRDPYNWLASVHKGELTHGPGSPPLDERIRTWKEQVELMRSGYQGIGILYNSWVSDVTYRQHLAECRLRLRFSDLGLRYMPPYGGGSSWYDKGTCTTPDLSPKGVTTRYLEFVDDPVYRGYFDEEIHSLSFEVLGFEPPKELR